jgi:predicted RNA binding protein YcfA (HicA-like mRNA interferase family)
MPARLRRLSGREVLRALSAFGFEVVATRGSHAKLRRILPDGTRQILTIPLHRTLADGTLRAIFRQASRYVAEEALRPWFFTGDGG